MIMTKTNLLYGRGVVENNPLQVWNTWATLSRHSILGVSALTYLGRIIMMHNFTITTAPQHQYGYISVAPFSHSRHLLSASLLGWSKGEFAESSWMHLVSGKMTASTQFSYFNPRPAEAGPWMVGDLYLGFQPSLPSALLSFRNLTPLPPTLCSPGSFSNLHPLQVCMTQWRKQESWK